MPVTFAPYPVPVVVKDEKGNDKEAYLLYVESGKTFENDIWCCVICEGGMVRHYATADVKVFANATFGIKKI